MANETFKFGNSRWAVKENSILAYNDSNNNFKPLPFDFTRASTATRVNEDGLIEVVKSGIPRIDYTDNPDGHLLLEPSRTNLITYSEDLTQSTKFGTATVTSNTTTSPDGTLTADTISGATDVVWASNNVRLAFTVSSSTTYTFSCYVKLGTATTVKIALRDGGTGATTESTALTTQGWNRLTVTATTGASTTSLSGLLGAADGTFYAWGAQCEEGSYATSYIPTSGTTETRAAETCTGAGNAQVFNDSEGVLFANVAALAVETTSRRITIFASVSGEIVEFIYWGDGTIRNRVFAGSAAQANLILYGVTETNFNKFAIKWKVDDFAFWLNGSESATDLSGSTPSGLYNLTFGSNNTPTNPFYGKIKQIGVYDTALTDEELETLTT